MNETVCRVCHLIWSHLNIFRDANFSYHLADERRETTDIQVWRHLKVVSKSLICIIHYSMYLPGSYRGNSVLQWKLMQKQVVNYVTQEGRQF